MATSIQVIGDNGQAFKDLDLIAAVCLLERRLDATQIPEPKVQALVTRWQDALTGYGPGTIDLGLDDLSSDAELCAQLSLLLSTLRGEILSYGSVVPAALLNESNRAPGVTFYDYPVARLVVALERLAEMLSPRDTIAQR